MRHDHRIAVAAATLLALGAVVVFRETGLFEPLALTAYDAFAGASTSSARVDAGTVVIGATESDIARFGWPLPDSVLDRAFTVLGQDRASVVALDIYRPTVCDPSSLAHWTSGSLPAVVFADKLGAGVSDAVSAPACAPVDRVGFTDVTPDDDHLMRRILFIAQLHDSTRYSLAYQAVVHRMALDGVAPSATTDGYPMLGRWTLVPLEQSDGEYVRVDAGGYQTLVTRTPTVSDIPFYSLGTLLDGGVPVGALAGRIVFIGAAAPSLPDFQHIGGSSRSQQAKPGVFAHALAASQALHLARGDGIATPISVLPDWLEWAYVILAAILGGWIAVASSSIRRLVFAVAVILLGMLVVAWLAMRASWWIPVVTPISVLLLSTAASLAVLAVLERRDRGALMDLFSRHVSREIADEIWRRRHEFTVDGRPKPVRLPVTVLFADMRGYTAIAERVEPEALMSWLNSFMSDMANEVMRHQGIVDDYAGDGIKADFGIPFPRPDQNGDVDNARRAVACALAMGRRLSDLNGRWIAEGLPAVGVRIGIASGMAVAGSVGSQHRLKYTVVGETVNRAARLESLDRTSEQMGTASCRILVDRATRDAVGELFDCCHLGAVLLKGKELPVDVYQVRFVPQPGVPG